MVLIITAMAISLVQLSAISRQLSALSLLLQADS
jgi:hypothetical protein